MLTLIYAIVAFIITFFLVPLTIKVAKITGTLDVPDGKLKVHKQAIPYLGGLAVYGGFIITLTLICFFQKIPLLFLVGTTFLLIVGLIDDLFVLSPAKKLLGQIIATLYFVKSGYSFPENYCFSPTITSLLSCLWILIVINAFNLIDVMDGLATIVACMVSFSFIISIYITGNTLYAPVLVVFLGALCAFLLYNRPQARIYLGDAGSLFIGGLLACISVAIPWSTYTQVGIIAPVLILLIPLLEVITLIIIRSYKAIPFYYGSPDHFSLYLQKNGWSRQEILLYVVAYSLFLLALSLMLLLNNDFIKIKLLLTLALIIFWYCALFVKKSSFYAFRYHS